MSTTHLNCAMNVKDMLPLTANYTVTYNGGTVEEFKGPLFMCEMFCKGTIFNASRSTALAQQIETNGDRP